MEEGCHGRTISREEVIVPTERQKFFGLSHRYLLHFFIVFLTCFTVYRSLFLGVCILPGHVLDTMPSLRASFDAWPEELRNSVLFETVVPMPYISPPIR